MSIEAALVETKKRLSEEELAALEKLASQAISDKSFAKDLALNPRASLQKTGLTLEKLEGAVIKIPDLNPSNVFCTCCYSNKKTDRVCGLFYWGVP